MISLFQSSSLDNSRQPTGCPFLRPALPIEAFLPHRPCPDSLAGLAKNLRLHPDGRYRWHWDPALLHFSDTELTPALGARLTATAGRLRLPVMLVRGGGSELVSEADAEHFLVLVPGARYANIADAGHMVAGDVNDRFGDAVIDFLQSSRTMKTS
jgi:pimeloyl-ACP methyl ester carboxylesterase